MAAIGILGGGLIGAGWAALFAHYGYEVRVYDNCAATPSLISATVERARPILEKTSPGPADGEISHVTAYDALQGVDFIQECLPEKLDIKREVLAHIEPFLRSETPIASSSSGMDPAQIGQDLSYPERVLIGHPCNPPYLMPLVEIVPTDNANPQVINATQAIYERAGRKVVRLRKRVPGHLVNRLQAAIWREMLHLWQADVADLDEIGEALKHGLAPRWCLLSPTEVFQLSGGPAGMAGFCDNLGPEMDRWWSALGQPKFDDQIANALVAAVQNADTQKLAQYRDDNLPSLLNCCSDAAHEFI